MRWLATCLICCLPVPAFSHPHVFIDTGLEFVVDDAGNLTHVRVTWAYDEFYSLLVLEEYRLDQDSDGVLTKEEEQYLSGFDAQWVDGYNGDLVIRRGDLEIPLSGPLESRATTQDARIVTTHTRAIQGEPVPARDLSIKAFDETFYTAYELTRPLTISGPASCGVERSDPDIDAELAQMQAFLLSLDASYDLEENDIPLVGEKFASEIRLSCPDT